MFVSKRHVRALMRYDGRYIVCWTLLLVDTQFNLMALTHPLVLR